MQVLEAIRIDACECQKPGWCQRYKRDMVGRLWCICQGNGTSGMSPEEEQDHRNLFLAWAEDREPPKVENRNGHVQQQHTPTLCCYADRKAVRDEHDKPLMRQCCEPG